MFRNILRRMRKSTPLKYPLTVTVVVTLRNEDEIRNVLRDRKNMASVYGEHVLSLLDEGVARKYPNGLGVLA